MHDTRVFNKNPMTLLIFRGWKTWKQSSRIFRSGFTRRWLLFYSLSPKTIRCNNNPSHRRIIHKPSDAKTTGPNKSKACPHRSDARGEISNGLREVDFFDSVERRKARGEYIIYTCDVRFVFFFRRTRILYEIIIYFCSTHNELIWKTIEPLSCVPYEEVVTRFTTYTRRRLLPGLLISTVSLWKIFSSAH